MRIGGILLMAGDGLRLGASIPKQFLILGGKQIYQHALDKMIESDLFDEIVLVSHPNWIKDGMIAGGKTRQESSFLGLNRFKKMPDIVLIHDAVRPFVTQEILEENIEKAITFGAVDTCIPSVDTLVQVSDMQIANIPDRKNFMRGQTPQTFRMDWILEAHLKAQEIGIQNATDDCTLISLLGKPIQIVLGDEKNIKITSEFDLIIAEQIYTRV